MIAKLSNQELNSKLKSLISTERKLLKTILDHINEVDSRKLYLEMAYPSLYEYLVKECGYSGSAAMRRISAAQDIPVVAEKIQNGELNLSQIGELSRAIKEKEKSGHVVSLSARSQIVSCISGKSTAQSQREIAQALNLELKMPEKTFVQKDDSVHLQITLTAKQFENLLECKDKAANVLLAENGDVSLASVIGLLAEQFLSRKSGPVQKKHQDRGTGQTHGSVNNGDHGIETEKSNKSLTPKTKRSVLSRDLCCQYRDPNTGKICGSTFNLEVDHRQPRWADGSHALSNLQTLCRAHNGFKYRKETNLRLL